MSKVNIEFHRTVFYSEEVEVTKEEYDNLKRLCELGTPTADLKLEKIVDDLVDVNDWETADEAEDISITFLDDKEFEDSDKDDNLTNHDDNGLNVDGN